VRIGSSAGVRDLYLPGTSAHQRRSEQHLATLDLGSSASSSHGSLVVLGCVGLGPLAVLITRAGGVVSEGARGEAGWVAGGAADSRAHPERSRCSFSLVIRSVDNCAPVKLGTNTCLQKGA
jgi:hypothetical protein